MKRTLRNLAIAFVAVAAAILYTNPRPAQADETAAPQADLSKACIDGNGPGWRELSMDDFENVNCDPDTWSWKDGVFHSTGSPNGVIRMHKPLTNFELVVQWRMLKYAGNSGVYIWATEDSLKTLPRNTFPDGIEVQVLDHGYKTEYEKSGKKADWFTTNGDVFPTGKCDMKPFPPAAPDGKRSFPRKELSKGTPEWNHYYVRAINGEVRLWVNGEEVSGGSNCKPATGYVCLESEGSPVEFKNFRIRELP